MAKEWIDDNPTVYFRFGAIMYTDLAFSLFTNAKKKKYPFIINLTDDVDAVQEFINERVPRFSSIKFANDWESGYYFLLNKMNWDEDAEKVVVHMGHVPGHGRGYTMTIKLHSTYFFIPRYKENRKESKEVHKKVQDIYRGKMSKIISELARKDFKFYCLNGNKISSFCFWRVSDQFHKNGGKRFVIKDLFGYTCDKEEDVFVDIETLKDQFDDFFSNVIKSSVNDEDADEFEKKCKLKLKKDLKSFFQENDYPFKFHDSSDEDDDFEQIPSPQPSIDEPINNKALKRPQMLQKIQSTSIPDQNASLTTLPRSLKEKAKIPKLKASDQSIVITKYLRSCIHDEKRKLFLTKVTCSDRSELEGTLNNLLEKVFSNLNTEIISYYIEFNKNNCIVKYLDQTQPIQSLPPYFNAQRRPHKGLPYRICILLRSATFSSISNINKDCISFAFQLDIRKKSLDSIYEPIVKYISSGIIENKYQKNGSPIPKIYYYSDMKFIEIKNFEIVESNEFIPIFAIWDSPLVFDVVERLFKMHIIEEQLH